MASWLHRTVLAGLLLAAYLYAWTPARTAWIEHGAGPLLETVTSAETGVSVRPAAQTVHIQCPDGATIGHTAPAGVKFFLPALFLLLIAPQRPHLGAFFTGHLALGALALGVLALTPTGVTGALARFVQTYGVDAYSLAVPVFVFARQR